MRIAGIDKDILRLAAPAIVNNVTVPLLGLCDTAIAGHLGGARFLGAIAVGSMMLNVFFWLSGFLRMGTTGLTANSYGARSNRGIREVLRKALTIAIIIGITVVVFQNPVNNFVARYLSPGGEVSDLATQYFRICVWGVPAQLMVMAITGWLIGLQTTTVPMGISIANNILNISFSLFLAFGADLGFRGIAIATVIANWVAALGSVVWMLFTLRRYAPGDEESANPIRWSAFFKVNGSLFVRSACIMLVTLNVTATGARLGEEILAANAIIMQFFMFFSYFMDGFAFSGEALAGRYAGAREKGLIRKTVRHLLGWGAVMATVFFLIYRYLTPAIAGLLTDETSVVETVMKYKLWIELLPPLTVLAFIFDGIFVGLTRTGAMMWATIAGAALFFIVLHGLGAMPDNTLLWISFETYLLIRGMGLGGLYALGNIKTKEL